MIHFVFLASVLGQRPPTRLLISGQPQSELHFGGSALTLVHNASVQDELVCSGKLRATDVLIEGTSTTVADLIDEVATLKTKVASLPPGRNLLINGNMDIWQRGTSASGSTRDFYAADRWYVYAPANATRSSDVPPSAGAAYSLRVQSSNWHGGVAQRIEGLEKYMAEGAKLTMSAWLKGPAGKTLHYDIGWLTSVSPVAPINLRGGWQREERTFEFPPGFAASSEGGGDLHVHFVRNFRHRHSLTSGDVVFLAQAQAEIGAIATAFDLRLPPAEMILCERYYQRIVSPRANTLLGIGLSEFGGQSLLLTIPLTTRLRMEGSTFHADGRDAGSPPKGNVTLGGTFRIGGYSSSGGNLDATTPLGAWRIMSHAAELDLKSNFAMSPSVPYPVRFENNSAVIFDAELYPPSPLPPSPLPPPGTWTLDVASLGADLKGFYGGFTDDVYGYLVPSRFGPGYGNGGDYGAKVVRFALNNFDLSSVSVLDLASVEPDLKGYMTGFRSGAYGYLVPWYSGVPSYNGKIVRFALDNFDVSGVSVLDLADVDSNQYPSINQGYIGGFATGGFGYLVPMQRHGNLVRIRLNNFDVSGVTVLDIEPLGGPTSSPTSPSGMLFGGFQGGFSDGSYGYYYPRQYASGNDQGFLVRVALDSFDANGVSMLNFTNIDPTITGFNGGFAYGGYGYLVPFVNRWTPGGYNTKIVRFALANFDETGMSTVELTTLHPTPERGGFYSGGFTDGVYGYLVPSRNDSNAVRFDLQNFTVSSLSQLELANELDMCGFQGGFSDGQFGYLVPSACLRTGESSKVVRISAYSWQ